ncbi:hypothetical protein ACFQQB_27790 [Nonomuraea rubra]
MTEMKPGDESPDLDNLSDAAKRLLSEAEDAANLDALQGVWTAINPLGKAGEITAPEAELVRARVRALKGQMTSESHGAAA